MEANEPFDLSIYIDRFCIIETQECRYIDSRYGNIIPEDQLHIQYRKSESINVHAVVEIKYIIQEENKFYIACLNAYGEEVIDHCIYYPVKNLFADCNYDPSIVIPYIRKEHMDYFNMNENLTELNTSCDYFKYTRKIIRRLKPVGETYHMMDCSDVNEGFTRTYDIHEEKKHSPRPEGYLEINNTKQGIIIEQVDEEGEVIYDNTKSKEINSLHNESAHDIIKELDAELGIDENIISREKRLQNEIVERLTCEKDKLYCLMLQKKSSQEDVLSRIRLLQATYEKFERDAEEINKQIRQLDCFIASEYYKDQKPLEIPVLEPRPDNIA